MRDGDWSQFKDKRILLLQGPLGPFFHHVGTWLRRSGAASVTKVNFNGGDWVFSSGAAFNFRSDMADWPATLASLVERLQIDTVMLYGDCREIHVPAQSVAETAGLDLWVFEEGYVRPNYITLERHGVNNRSRLSRDPDFYRQLDASGPPVHPREDIVGGAFWHAAVWAVLYCLASVLLRPWFPKYRHHRPLNVFEAIPWLRSAIRKPVFAHRERDVIHRLQGNLSKKYYLLPLQVSIDSQVHVHSDFDSIVHCIEDVVASFIECADDSTFLVIKHHPMDRGFHDYGEIIRALGEKRGVGDRLIYIHDQHLPTILDHAKGVVVINSTVGMQALHHGVPVMVLGQALYDMAGLTHQGGIDSFWHACDTARPDPTLYWNFRCHMIQETQVNGNFYRVDLMRSAFDRGNESRLDAEPLESNGATVSHPSKPVVDERIVVSPSSTPSLGGVVRPRFSAAPMGQGPVDRSGQEVHPGRSVVRPVFGAMQAAEAYSDRLAVGQLSYVQARADPGSEHDHRGPRGRLSDPCSPHR